MDTYKDNFQAPKAKHPLKVLIVGAGVAGLAAAIGLKQAGHDVEIFEQVRQLAEVGAGIQMAPNAARILGRFGLLEKLMEKANVLDKNSLRRWKDNEELGTAPLMPSIGKKYNAPLSVIHRADLQNILWAAAESNKVPIHIGTKVIAADTEFAGSIQLANGEWVKGDVIICADGVKSDLRRQMASAHGVKDRSVPTGDAAYRVLIPKDRMGQDERALKLLSEDVGMRWMGPGGHIMAYPIKRNTVYNMVLLHPQKENTEGTESWTNKGDKKEMMDFYKDWNPLVQDLLSYVPEGDVMEWTLNSHVPLPSWVQNRCVLVGDACHPMLPYVAQGAAQAIEDAGVLSCCLSLIPSSSAEDIATALKIYELVRKERGERIQASAGTTRTALHLPDGEEQRKRDEAIRQSAKGEGGGHNPDLWADHEWQDFMWGVDVMDEVVSKWDNLVAKAQGHAPEGVRGSTY